MRLALHGPNRFDGHEQNALSQWRCDEAMSRVEADRVIVDRMNNDRASPGDLRGGRTAAERIGKQIGAKAEPLEVGRDGQPSDQQQRSEEHTSELQSLMSNSNAVFCMKITKHNTVLRITI